MIIDLFLPNLTFRDAGSGSLCAIRSTDRRLVCDSADSEPAATPKEAAASRTITWIASLSGVRRISLFFFLSVDPLN